MPLLMIFGPEGDQGDLMVIYRRLRGQKAPASKTPPPAASTSTKDIGVELTKQDSQVSEAPTV